MGDGVDGFFVPMKTSEGLAGSTVDVAQVTEPNEGMVQEEEERMMWESASAISDLLKIQR